MFSNEYSCRGRCMSHYSSRFAALCLCCGLASLLPQVGVSDVVTIPDPYYTNQITTVEAWVELNTESAIVLDGDGWNDFYTNIIEQTSTLYNIFETIELNSDPLGIASDLDAYFDHYANLFNNAYPNMSSGRLWLSFKNQIMTYVTNHVASIQDQAILGEQQVSRVNSIVDELDTLYRRDIISSVSFGQDFGQTVVGGGCTCPDYTVYLQGLYAVQFQWRAEWESYVNSITNLLDTLVSNGFFDFDWDSLNAIDLYRLTALDQINADYGFTTFVDRVARYYLSPRVSAVTNAVGALGNALPLWVRMDDFSWLPLAFGVTNVLDDLGQRFPLLVELAEQSQFPDTMAVTNFYKNGRLVPLYVVETNDLSDLEDMESRADQMTTSDLEPSTAMFQGFPSGVDFDDVTDAATFDDLVVDDLPSMVQVVDSYTFRWADMSGRRAGGSYTVTSGYWSLSSGASSFLRSCHDLFEALWWLAAAAFSAPFLWWAFELGLRLTAFVYAVLNNKDSAAAFGRLIRLRGFGAD